MMKRIFVYIVLLFMVGSLSAQEFIRYPNRALKNKIEALDDSVSNYSTDITALSDSVSNYSADITVLNDSVTNYSTDLVALDTSVDSIKTIVSPSDSTIIADSLVVNGIVYLDTYYDDLRVPLTNTRINPANTEPDFEDSGDGTFGWGFDAANDSSWVLNFIAQLPHGWKEGTNLDAHIHWSPNSTNTGDVVWKLIYNVTGVNGTFGATDTLRVADAADGTANKHQLTEIGEIDMSGISGVSAIIKGSIARMGDATDDSFTGTAYGWEIDFHYQFDAPGSRDEYIK